MVNHPRRNKRMIVVSVTRQIYHVVRDGHGNIIEDTRPTELTEIGEQFVIPGCERKPTESEPQAELWGSKC